MNNNRKQKNWQKQLAHLSWNIL